MAKTIRWKNPPRQRASWPHVRLLLILLLFGFWSHRHFGLSLASLPAIKENLTGMFGFLYFCALISRALVELCLEIAAFPFYATAALNEWLYRGCYWAFRMLLRLLYLPRVSALAALLGELGLFLVLWRLIGALLRRYCGLLIS